MVSLLLLGAGIVAHSVPVTAEEGALLKLLLGFFSSFFVAVHSN